MWVTHSAKVYNGAAYTVAAPETTIGSVAEVINYVNHAPALTQVRSSYKFEGLNIGACKGAGTSQTFTVNGADIHGCPLRMHTGLKRDGDLFTPKWARYRNSAGADFFTCDACGACVNDCNTLTDTGLNNRSTADQRIFGNCYARNRHSNICKIERSAYETCLQGCRPNCDDALAAELGLFWWVKDWSFVMIF